MPVHATKSLPDGIGQLEPSPEIGQDSVHTMNPWPRKSSHVSPGMQSLPVHGSYSVPVQMAADPEPDPALEPEPSAESGFACPPPPHARTHAMAATDPRAALTPRSPRNG